MQDYIWQDVFQSFSTHKVSVSMLTMLHGHVANDVTNI